MPTRLRTNPDLADVVALARALERDRQRTTRELRERESRLARELPVGEENRVAIALAWLDAVENEDDAVRSIHQRAHTAIQLTGFFIALAAIIVGWATTLAVFYFDGTGRVNAVAVLAILVGLPGVLLVPFIFATLPPRVTRKLPGTGAVAALARGLSPGRFAQWLWRVLARDGGETVALTADRAERHQRVYSAIQTWALLRWSQWFALWFQITALAASLALVVFSDLAFGWSTTLTTGNAALDAHRVHRVTEIVATPWRWAVPEAQPSLALIEESRYFRVASEAVSTEQAARLGGWWQFVVLTIAVYGVLPRFITLAVVQGRLQAATRASVIGAPGFSAVLRRVHAARIETVATQAERADPNPATPEGAAPSTRPGAGNIRAVINWSEVPVDAGVLETAFPDAQLFSAGGAASVEQDAGVIEQLGVSRETGGGDVLILVKGWEPPLMEFVDFVKALRARISGEAAEIIVLPVGFDNGDPNLVGAAPAQLKLWRDKLARIGDPSLRVAADHQEAVA